MAKTRYPIVARYLGPWERRLGHTGGTCLPKHIGQKNLLSLPSSSPPAAKRAKLFPNVLEDLTSMDPLDPADLVILKKHFKLALEETAAKFMVGHTKPLLSKSSFWNG